MSDHLFKNNISLIQNCNAHVEIRTGISFLPKLVQAMLSTYSLKEIKEISYLCLALKPYFYIGEHQIQSHVTICYGEPLGNKMETLVYHITPTLKHCCSVALKH